MQYETYMNTITTQTMTTKTFTVKENDTTRKLWIGHIEIIQDYISVSD